MSALAGAEDVDPVKTTRGHLLDALHRVTVALCVLEVEGDTAQAMDAGGWLDDMATRTAHAKEALGLGHPEPAVAKRVDQIRLDLAAVRDRLPAGDEREEIDYAIEDLREVLDTLRRSGVEEAPGVSISSREPGCHGGGGGTP